MPNPGREQPANSVTEELSELHPWNLSGYHVDHVLLLVLMHYCYGTLFWQPFPCKPAVCMAILLAAKCPELHMLDPIASSFHIENLQVKNIPWWVSLIPCYNGAGLKKLSLKLHSGVVWNVCLLEAEGKNWGVDQALFAEAYCFESFSWVPFCVKICMQINADWKGTSNEHPWWHAKWGQCGYH